MLSYSSKSIIIADFQQVFTCLILGGYLLKVDLDLRKTKQRRKLLDLFNIVQKPMTADQILKYCHLECPNMALTTVYRNLDRLIDMGCIAKTVYPDGAARYTSADIGHSHMVTCRLCHAQVELVSCPVQMSEDLVAKHTGYQIEHHYLEYFGLCPNCQKNDLAFQRQKVTNIGIPQAGEYAEDEDEDDEESHATK